MKTVKKIDGLLVSTVLLLVGAVILLIFSGVMWRKFVYYSDDRVVWGAIEKALSTKGVETTIDESTDQLTQRLTTKLDLSGDIASESLTEFKDDQLDSAIKTISTRTNDYLFYGRNQSVANPRLSELEGTWVDISIEGRGESKGLADTLTNGSLIFVGNLSGPDQKALVRQMKDERIYTIVGQSVVSQSGDSSARVYKLQINTKAFNTVLKRYLALMELPIASEEVDLTNSSDELEPTFEIAILPESREIVEVGFPTINSSGSRQYTNWGVAQEFALPSSTITAQQLEERVQQLNAKN